MKQFLEKTHEDMKKTSLIFKGLYFLEIQTTDPKVIIFNELFQGWHHLGERLAGSDGFDNEGIPWITTWAPWYFSWEIYSLKLTRSIKTWWLGDSFPFGKAYFQGANS